MNTNKVVGNNKGMTLLEILVAMVLFATVVMCANSFMISFIQNKKSIKTFTQATALGNKMLDSIRTLPYSALQSSETLVDSTFNCSWQITPNAVIEMKVVNLTVEWFTGQRRHTVNLSTNISRQ